MDGFDLASGVDDSLIGGGDGGALSDAVSSGDGGGAGSDFSGGGGDGGLSPLVQMFLQGQQVPEVQAGSSGGGAGDSPLGSPGGAQAGGFNFNAARDSQAYNDMAGIKPANSQEGFLQKIMRGLGLADHGGNVDLSDPKQLAQWLKLITAGGGIASALFHRKPTGYMSPQDMLAAQGGGAKGMTWNPAQQSAASTYFNNPTPAWNQRPFALAQPGAVEQRGHTYAMGGAVGYADGGEAGGALSQVAGGQDDVIDAKLAPGEFVWDADTVSALGDGSNEAGAKKLEAFRQAIREHKRSAPPNKIPPRAHPMAAYMRKGAK